MPEKIKPAYYQTDSPYEPWKIIKFWKLDYHRASALVYILRAGIKNVNTYCEDLTKAITHLSQHIEDTKENENS